MSVFTHFITLYIHGKTGAIRQTLPLLPDSMSLHLSERASHSAHKAPLALHIVFQIFSALLITGHSCFITNDVFCFHPCLAGFLNQPIQFFSICFFSTGYNRRCDNPFFCHSYMCLITKERSICCFMPCFSICIH